MAQTTSKRRFEFVDGTSSKFWEISVVQTSVYVQFGRIGANGQGVTKSFPDETAANQHAAKLIKQKIGKGYIPVT